MKIYTFLLLFIVNTAWGQQSSKLNIDLHLQLKQTEPNLYDSIYVAALVKGDLGAIEQIVTELPTNKYKYGVSNIASVYISLTTVQELLASTLVQRVEAREAIMHNLTYPEDTAMLNNNNAWNVHLGAGGVLPYGFQGEGVLLGMIDDGIEWRHPDFLNADSSTRIMYIWDQTSIDNNYYESYFGYGASWDSSDLNTYQCTHQVGPHGSHVMGIAGGNGLASGKFVGLAPKADLACVKVKGSGFLSSFVDGLHYLFTKADQRGQACVVNSSVGAYTSGHDSKDLYAQLVDNLLMAKSGRALIQAAGNERGTNFHLGVIHNNNISKTRFRKAANTYYTQFSMYADTLDFQNIDFSLQLFDQTTQQMKAQTLVYNVLQDFVFSGGVAQVQQVLFYDNNGNAVTLEIYIDQYEDAYEIYIRIGSLQNDGDWQLTTTGVGKYDVWSKTNLTGTTNMLSNVNIPNYTSPDDIQSIVGYWTTSDKVITVGSYQNRNYHVNYSGDTAALYTSTFPKYGISHFSSLGPTRTGQQKPDITAPGGQVLSASTFGTLNYYKQIYDTRLNEDGWHITNRGTSMSAPMVAGAVALYLQCKPYADYADIKQAIESSARIDNYVFAQSFTLPNIHWGYGKLDVYELVKSCLIYGCTDSIAINYNTLATVSDSSCGYLISSIANIEATSFLSCYPNPSQHTINIGYELKKGQVLDNAQINICNVLGQVVQQINLNKNKGTISWTKAKLAAGSYWIVLENEGKKEKVQQVVFFD